MQFFRVQPIHFIRNLIVYKIITAFRELNRNIVRVTPRVRQIYVKLLHTHLVFAISLDSPKYTQRRSRTHEYVFNICTLTKGRARGMDDVCDKRDTAGLRLIMCAHVNSPPEVTGSACCVRITANRCLISLSA